MPDIFSNVIVHRLNVDSKCKPVQQKKRNFAPEKQKTIDKEFDKLLAADFIREANYPDWLANMVMVKKANDK